MSAAARRRLVALGPAAVALALAVLAYAPALRPGRQLAARDVLPLYYRMFLRVAEAHRALALPARDPERGCGAALYADPLSQAAYPPALVRAVLPYDQGFVLWFVLHAALAGAGAAHLARTLGATSRGACLAAAGATLAGPLLSNCRCPNLLAGAAWSGFALAGFVRLLDGHAPGGAGALRRQAALAAASVGLMLLAGGIEVLLLLGLGLAAVLAVRAAQVAAGADARPDAAGRLGLGALRVAGATALGAALSAVHLLPVLRLLPETARGTIPTAEAAAWSLHPWRLLETVVPGLAPGTNPAWADALVAAGAFAPFGSPLHPSVHLGLPLVALAAAALLQPGRGSLAGRWARPLAAACGLWLLVALGRHTALIGQDPRTSFFALVHALPLFDGWRYPGKALIPLAVVLPALAAVGLARVAPPLRVKAAAVGLAALVVGARVDEDVVFTGPLAWYHDPPAAARQALAAEARSGRSPPGRFVRLDTPRLPPRSDGRTARERHREILLEDLPGLFGLQDVAAYGPFVNRRLGPWLRTCQAPAATPDLAGPGGLDLGRLRDDAGVAHALLPPPRGLVHLTPPPRARLIEGRGQVTLRHWEATRIALDVEVEEGPGLVLISEAFDPGWRATLAPRDGVAAPVALEEARVAFLGVRVPRGAATLTLEYRVPGLVPGALLTGAALLALAALLLHGPRSLRLS